MDAGVDCDAAPRRAVTAAAPFDPHYMALIEKFNRVQFFEAHEGLDVRKATALLRDVLRGRNLLAEGTPPDLEPARP